MRWAVVKNQASEPYWIVFPAMAMARWVLPRSGLPERTRLRPDPTKSGARYGAMRSRRMPSLGANEKSSTDLKNGN